MIKRIVKMTFKNECVEDFKKLIAEKHHLIRNFQGCSDLEILQDIKNKNIFFTYSVWDREASLENYRNSELFNEVWSVTKTFFGDKPQAWTVNTLEF